MLNITNPVSVPIEAPTPVALLPVVTVAFLRARAPRDRKRSGAV